MLSEYFGHLHQVAEKGLQSPSSQEQQVGQGGQNASTAS